MQFSPVTQLFPSISHWPLCRSTPWIQLPCLTMSADFSFCLTYHNFSCSLRPSDHSLSSYPSRASAFSIWHANGLGKFLSVPVNSASRPVPRFLSGLTLQRNVLFPDLLAPSDIWLPGSLELCPESLGPLFTLLPNPIFWDYCLDQRIQVYLSRQTVCMIAVS